MKFPEKPTCHVVNPVFKMTDAIVWYEPATERKDLAHHAASHYRTCSYCGSIHPEDLLKILQEHPTALTGADWKYGWPHKFYLNGKLGLPFGKFYNDHLRDAGYDREAFILLISLIEKSTQIRFNIDPAKGLGFSAPSPGYQAG